MASISLKTVIAKTNEWLNNLAQIVARYKRPNLLILFVLLMNCFIILVHGLIKYPHNYPERTVKYILLLYMGGLFGYFINIIIESSVLFYLSKKKIEGIKFVNFCLGILLFSFPPILANLINLIFPIYPSNVNDVYSIFSISYISGLKIQNVIGQTALNMLDLVEIAKIFTLSFFIKSVSRVSMINAVLLVLLVQYLLYVVSVIGL